MENGMESPQKIKNRITIWPSHYTPWYLSEEDENTNSNRYMHTYIHCNIIYNSQDMEAIYIYDGILLSHKNLEWNLAIWNNMDGSRGYYPKWNKSERDT